ncbi:MAG: hypothetical protein R2838_00140 [Caldilineaceae bacterium]
MTSVRKGNFVSRGTADDLATTEQNLLRQAADGRWAPPDRSVPVPTLLRQIILQRVNRLGEQSKAHG